MHARGELAESAASLLPMVAEAARHKRDSQHHNFLETILKQVPGSFSDLLEDCIMARSVSPSLSNTITSKHSRRQASCENWLPDCFTCHRLFTYHSLSSLERTSIISYYSLERASIISIDDRVHVFQPDGFLRSWVTVQSTSGSACMRLPFPSQTYVCTHTHTHGHNQL